MSRSKWIAAIVGLLVAASLAVAAAFAAGMGDQGDDFEVDTSEPGQPAPAEPASDTADGETSTSGGGTSGAGGIDPGGASSPSRGGPVAPGPDTPVSSDDHPAPAPTIVEDPSSAFSGIRTFEDCVAAGYPVAESYPEQCRTPDGRLFVRVID